MLAYAFVKAHCGAIKVATRKSDLFKVIQKDNKMLREFISRFQMERMDLPLVIDDWAIQAFTQVELRVEDDQLGAPIGSIYPNRPVDRVKRDDDRERRSNRDRYPPYGRDRRNNGPRHKPIRNVRRNDRGQSSRGRLSKSSFDRDVGTNKAPRLSEYNFNVDASAIVSTIRRIKDSRWPRPMQTDPSQRNPNQICKYHGTHGHKMEDCRQLTKEVARLFNEGHLREFLSERAKNHFKNKDSNRQNELEEPQHVIHMIVGGFDIPQKSVFKCTKVTITRKKRTRYYLTEKTLSFNDEDAEGIEQPHNDTLVISVLMNKIQVKCVWVDPGSPANIIRSSVVEQLGLKDQIVSATRKLNGFSMASETTKGEIVLPVNVAGTIQKTKFHVIEGNMRYNTLLARPWIHNIRAVPSTLHQVLKFPISQEVKIMYGEQHAAKEMFALDEVTPVSALSSTKGSDSKGKQEAKLQPHTLVST
uniref:Uncharacterized protein LOC104243247 n=1 Tax=Nicotiana sylvestris TaxID=4096 RepID=A0A1U7XXP7_NICSY|nr:PREDICTED: uncharacterized protein LOC104243247 [Nicotiana sylvestris]